MDETLHKFLALVIDGGDLSPSATVALFPREKPFIPAGLEGLRSKPIRSGGGKHYHSLPIIFGVITSKKKRVKCA